MSAFNNPITEIMSLRTLKRLQPVHTGVRVLQYVFVCLFLLIQMSCSPASQEFKSNPVFLFDVENIPFSDTLQQQFTRAWIPIFDQIEKKKPKPPKFYLKILKPETDWQQLVEFYRMSYGADPNWNDCQDEYRVPKQRKAQWLAYCSARMVFAVVTVDDSLQEGGLLPVALIEYRE
jgi:hypothetical protein